MAIWTIEKMETKNIGTLTDVVCKVFWRCEETLNSKSAKAIGDFELPSTSSSAFIQFEDLTEENAMSWVENNVNKTEIENSLQTMINSMANKDVKNNPWDNKVLEGA